MFGITDKDRIVYSPTGEPENCSAVFASKGEFAVLCEARGWSKAKVTAIWNANAGKSPFADCEKLKRFRNRPYGIDRLWGVIQRLAGALGADDVSDPVMRTASGEPMTNKQRERAIAKAPKVVKTPKPKPRVESTNGKFRDGSKGERAIALMSRENGATGKELQDALGWLPHTVRGFISTLQSKHGKRIESTKTKDGRTYKVTA